MKLTRMISIYESDLDLIEEGKTMYSRKGQSWSGPKSKETFVNEWNKEIEVLIIFKNAKKEDFKELKEKDIDDMDILDCDIDKYNEHRSNKDLELEIIDFSDGREDVGYIEIEVDYINNKINGGIK